LGPIRQRKNPDAFAASLATIVETPRFGSLPLRIPAMMRVAEGENTLFRPRFLFVASGAGQGCVKAMRIERLAKRLRLHHIGVNLRAADDRADAAGEPIAVDVNDQVQPKFTRALIAEGDHVAEFPGRIDVEQRKGWLCGMESFQREVQENRGILAD